MGEDRCPLLAFLRAELRQLVPPGRPTEDGPLLVTIKKAAEMLAIGQTEVWRLVGLGELPSVKMGRSRRVLVRGLEEYVRLRLQEAEGDRE